MQCSKHYYWINMNLVANIIIFLSDISFSDMYCRCYHKPTKVLLATTVYEQYNPYTQFLTTWKVVSRLNWHFLSGSDSCACDILQSLKMACRSSCHRIKEHVISKGYRLKISNLIFPIFQQYFQFCCPVSLISTSVVCLRWWAEVVLTGWVYEPSSSVLEVCLIAFE